MTPPRRKPGAKGKAVKLRVPKLGAATITLHPRVYAICMAHDGKAYHRSMYRRKATAVSIAKNRNRHLGESNFVLEVKPLRVVWPVTPKPPARKRGLRHD